MFRRLTVASGRHRCSYRSWRQCCSLMFVLSEGWLTGKEKDLTSSSVHLYRRGIILGKIPPPMELRDGRTMASEVAAAVRNLLIIS